jgi:uncharacterized protein (TIGR02594 family)
MPQLVRQSARSADRIGIRGAVAASVVVAVIAASLTAAMKLDPLLRKFAPNAEQREHQAPPVVGRTPTPVTPPAAPVVTIPAPAPAASQPTPAAPRPTQAAEPPSLPPALPELVLPPPRPHTQEVVEESTEDNGRGVRRQRDSRHQVARNMRNQRREHSEGAEAEAVPTGRGAYALVSEARRYIGTNPTNMARLWCARFTNFVLNRSGYRGTGSDAALSFRSYGRRVPGPRIGAIAVMRRKGGGHVGIVSGIDRHGNPILISGNNGRHGVAEVVYPRRRIIAYVMPQR